MKPTLRTPIWYLLTRHWLSLLGAGLVTTAVLSLLFVLPQHLRGRNDNPYVGIVIFFVLPVIFVLGLLLMPVGVYLSKRRIGAEVAEATFDRWVALKRVAWFFGVTTLLNILIGTQFTYRAIRHMETPQFCGSSCHVMIPEFASYQNSPHSRVECVACHVAPGAAGWVAGKANGVRQLMEVVFNKTPKPIASALASNRLVPARRTCEECHWPQEFGGVSLRVFSKYADDEANTRSETVLLMMIGGNKVPGIHGAHLGPGVHIRYAAADPARQTIPWVEYRNTTIGDVRTYASPDTPRDAPKDMSKYDMQCVDCHNRPTHVFDLPERAMDKSMVFSDIPASLPFVKKKGVELLKVTYRTRKDAADQLPANLFAFYQQNYPGIYAQRAPDIRQAGQAILAIYNRNVFPDLKVTWGTYPNNLGHTDFPGCFRCHDGTHATTDGKSITQDCNTCHQPLAMEETSPEILQTLGIAEKIQSVEKR